MTLGNLMPAQLNYKLICQSIRQIQQHLFTSIVVTTLMSGCSMASPQLHGPAGVDNYTGVLPASSPRKTITSFTNALQCMDDLLATSNTPHLLISLAPLHELSNYVTGVEDMVMTSLSTMSLNSKTIKVVANNPDDDPFYAHAKNQSFQAPEFFIRMSTPQFEEQVRATDNSGSLQLPVVPLDARIGSASNTSIVSIDMNMGRIETLQLLPGVYSRNSIKIISGRKSGSANIGDPSAASTDDYGLYTDLDMIDAGAEEIPFEKHLGGMEPLSSVGRLTKFGVNFEMNFNYREGRHAAVRTLIELGVIELVGKYAELPYQKCLTGELQDNTNGATPLKTATGKNPVSPYSDLQLRPKDAGTPVTYRHGDEVKLTLKTQSEAYVFCYYQLYNGDIHQIFPTPYHPSNLLAANQSIELPGDDRLKITVDSPGPDEKIQCVSHAPEKIDLLPEQLKVKEFEKLSVSSLQQLLELHRLSNGEFSSSDVFLIAPY